MKANELMIGDWVCYDGDTCYECPVKIEGMDVSCDFCITSDRDDAGFDGVIPIPLTPEILELNGYSKVNGQRYEIGEYESDFYIKVNPKKHFVHVNGKKNNVNLYDCKYVHELQHVFRLCGLTDLADNFKL